MRGSTSDLRLHTKSEKKKKKKNKLPLQKTQSTNKQKMLVRR